MSVSAPALRPIGIYDSGVGGLTVLRDIRARLPADDLIYVADAGYVPYGEKSRHAIVARALALADYFVSQDVKAIAVPCNTATAAAIGVLRERHPDLPIIGIEPAIKPAARLTRSQVIGVMATTGTLASARFRALVQREAPHARIVLQPCPSWVLAVEQGQVRGPAAAGLVAPAVDAVLAQGADVLVLGCTHFPFLREAIAARVGPDVPLLETGDAVARQLQRVLQERAWDHPGTVANASPGTTRFLTSGDPATLAQVASRLLDVPIVAEALPTAYA